MRIAGFEPARQWQLILSQWCLPIPPYPHIGKVFHLSTLQVYYSTKFQFRQDFFEEKLFVKQITQFG